MAHFYPVSPAYWDDEKVKRWNDSQQKFALYLLTCKHRNLEGLYVLPVAYAARDCRWTPAKARKYLDALVVEGFCEYDDDTEVVFLPNALAYYQPKSKPQVKGALADLGVIPSSPLKQRFMERCRELAPELADALTNGIADG